MVVGQPPSSSGSGTTTVRYGRQGRLSAVGLAAAVTLTVLLASAPAAVAAPTDPAAPQTAADVAAQGHELEVVTEQFNEAREHLAAQQIAVTQAQAELATLQADFDTLTIQLSGVARSAYTGPGMGHLQALMGSDSVAEFLDRVATLDALAGYTNDAIDDVTAAQVEVSAAAAAAEQAVQEAQQQVDEVSRQQQELQTQIAQYQAQYAELDAQQQEQADIAHGGVSLEAPTTVTAGSSGAQSVIDTAMAQLGDPYEWAAAGPDSFDCSGLTQFAFAAAGIALPHSSAMQARMGTPVSRGELLPGDLVYFYEPVSHIGIYLGGGQMVHASTSGEPVKVGSVDMPGYGGARRLLE